MLWLAVCDCQNVTVTGSHVHTTRMGTFVFVPDVLHDGHAVYINDHHEYLYFYAPIWLVGNDYTKNMAGVRSIGNGVCPTNVPSWEHYVDGKWTVVPLKITCKRGPCCISCACCFYYVVAFTVVFIEISSLSDVFFSQKAHVSYNLLLWFQCCKRHPRNNLKDPKQVCCLGWIC